MSPLPPAMPRSGTLTANMSRMATDENAAWTRSAAAGSDGEEYSSDAEGLMGSENVSPMDSPTTSRQAFLSRNPALVSGTSGGSFSARGSLDLAPSSTQGPTPRQTSRRERNRNAPTGSGDQSLVNELQANLVNEIRRLQALLLERDGEIRRLTEEKEETDKELGQWKPRALALIQVEDKLTQENWDLNVQRDELEGELKEHRGALKKSEDDRIKVTKDCAKLREESESQKADLEQLRKELDKLTQSRKTETAFARQEMAGMARQVSELNLALSKAREDADRQNFSRSFSRSMNLGNESLEASTDEENLHEAASNKRRAALESGNVPASPGSAYDDELAAATSPLAGRLSKDRNIPELRQKLAMAQKKSGKDTLDKRRLREQNAELRQLLHKAGLKAPGASEAESSDEDDAALWDDESVEHSPSAKRGKARGLPKSSTGRNIASRLGIGLGRPSRSAHDQTVHDEDEAEQVDEEVAEMPATSSSALRRSARRANVPRNVSFGAGSPLVQTAYLPGEDEHDASSTGHSTEQWHGTERADTSVVDPLPRPPSMVLAGETLGDELEGLGDDAVRASGTSFIGDESLARDLASAQQVTRSVSGPLPPAADDKNMQTDAQSSALADELAKKEREHAAVVEEHTKTLSAIRDAHAQALEQRDLALEKRDRDHAAAVAEQLAALAALREEHANTLNQRDTDHSKLLSDRGDAHKSALSELVAQHAKALDEREAAAERAVADKEEEHVKVLSAALAKQNETHKVASEGARTRHAQALAEEVAKGALALKAAEEAHRKLVSETKDSHKRAIDRLEVDHDKALKSKDGKHASEIEDLHLSHDAYVRDLEQAFNRNLRERDEIIRKSREEVEKMRERLSTLENELERLRREIQASGAAVLAAESAKRELECSAEETKAELEEARAIIATHNEKEDDAFEDASEAPSLSPNRTALEMDDGKHDAAVAMDRSGTEQSTQTQSEVDSPPTPADIEAFPSPPAAKARELKESAAQTDHEMWARVQETQLTRAGLPIPNNVLMLGGGAANQHVRDSVSTFGGNRDGTRIDPTSSTMMYTVGALTRQQAAASVSSRRPSMDSTISTDARFANPNEVALGQIPDRSKPPVMDVPPPPSMPPPANLPNRPTPRGRTSTSNSAQDKPPARPTSPPPAELVAAAGRRGSTLQVPPGERDALPARSASRASGHSGAASSNAISSTDSTSRGPPNGLHSRIASNQHSAPGDAASVASRRSRVSASNLAQQHLRAPSGGSFRSDVTSMLSPRMSIASSRASEYVDARNPSTGATGASSTKGMPPGTDPEVIAAITQTMIGNYMHKYVRRGLGRTGLSDKRHQRYFWLHPYTKMLSWTMTDPGGKGVQESTYKSAVIEDIQVVEDNNPSPPGLYHLSIIVKTPARDMKITAPNRERHEMWVSALGYLTSRTQLQANAGLGRVQNGRGGASTLAMQPNRADEADPDRPASRRERVSSSRPASITSRRLLSPRRSMASLGAGARARSENILDTGDNTETTPRPRAGTIGASSILSNKRRDTAAHEYLSQWGEVGRNNGPSSPSSYGKSSRKSFGHSRNLASDLYGESSQYRPSSRTSYAAPADPRLQTAEQMLEEDQERGGYDGLENVRACCNGAHDVGELAHRKYKEDLRKKREKEYRDLARTHREASSTASIRSRHSRQGSQGSSVAGGGIKSWRDTLKRAPSGTSTVASRNEPATSSSPPQLGPLNLNTPLEKRGKQTSSSQGSKSPGIFSAMTGQNAAPRSSVNSSAEQPMSARTSNSAEWYSSPEDLAAFIEIGEPQVDASAKTTELGSSAGSATPNARETNTFSQRVSAIRKSAGTSSKA
ncbi:Pleckstrin homology-like domain [Ceraceosorus bombacis]|uniref:Pleckstrin homology-like domain n=1 Tax=Ceraceosorus bombacis TaxID=401625 RepID=A0A0P1BGQ5_9BASI|nr:Pleckstrin homology-like domain [Ceraceosorus bombacis]